jgi:osmoprotectant transport system permease protein
MDPVARLIAWLTDPANWQGPNGVPIRLFEHLQLTAIALVIAGLIALPIGLILGHTGRGGFLAVSAANLGRAIPSYALLLIFFPIFGFGLEAPVLALVLLSLPPILTNTFVGMREVDRDMVEAARAMGMTARQLLAGIELPAALPVILTGVRTAAVQAVATATLAALIAGGGLGRYIVDGFALRVQGQGRLLAGALLVALLALATERFFTFLQGRLVSPGLHVQGPERPRAFNYPAEAGQPGGGVAF